MKVLQVLYSGLGGHGSVVTSLINADENALWENYLLFYGIEDLIPQYVKFCKDKKLTYKFVKKRRGVLNSSSATVRKFLKQIDPDVIILHSPNLILPVWRFSIGKKKTIIVVEHTPFNVKGFGENIASFFSLILAKKVVCLTSAYQERLKKKFFLLPVRKKTTIIQNGISLKRFKPTAKEITGLITVTMIGRFSNQKRQDLIIDAVHQAIMQKRIDQDVVFYLAGDGETKVRLEKKVNDLKLEKQIVFCGLLNEEQIIDLLAQTDIYIHASDAETMCTSVMQAMACGLPIVASNISGINNIVEDGQNAFLFDNTKPDKMIDFIFKLKNEEQLRKDMGICARGYVEKFFSSQKTFQQYNQLINAY